MSSVDFLHVELWHNMRGEKKHENVMSLDPYGNVFSIKQIK